MPINSATRRQRILTAAETLLPMLLLSVKLWFMNTTMLRVGRFTFLMTAFTILLLGGLCLLLRLFHRDHVPVLLSVYGFLSVLILCDSVYCAYTGKLPSAVMLQYLGQLGDVKGAIYDMVTFSRILYALDVPFWILYFVHFRRKLYRWAGAEKPSGTVAPKTALVTVSGITGAAALVCICGCLFTSFIPSYFKSEILTYHTLDLLQLVLPEDETIPALPGAQDRPDGEAIQAGAQVSPYYGIANGRNVITIQVEALQNFVIGMWYEGQELTPNLNAMIAQDTLYFDRYYYQIGGGNTADAEFAVNNSLYAPESEAAYSKYPDRDYYSMAKLLKENGYTTATAFHGYTDTFWNRKAAYPGQHFDAYLSGSDYYAAPDEVAGMGVSDGEFFVRAVDYLKTQESPFYAFMVTLSSHYAFELDDRFNSLTLRKDHVGTLFGNYLQSVHYVDQAFGQLIDALKAADLYDNCIMTIYGDHFGLPVYNWQCKLFMTELLGREYTYADHFNVPLIIHMPGSGITETVHHVGGHIDVMPTLLHLLGLENKRGIMFGYNILTTPDGVVYQQTHLPRGSFISDNVLYQYPLTGIAVNAEARAIDTWELLDPAPYADTVKQAQEAYELCMYLLEHNLVYYDAYEAAREAQNAS